jgi:hypothetical protein
MANCSIPNSTPAIGRTSTPLSRRSIKQSNSVARGGPTSLRAVAESGASRPFNAQRPTPNAQRSIERGGRWTLGVGRWAFSLRRVKGAWWSSRSSKPSSVPHTRDRGRFDSYPLRPDNCALETLSFFNVQRPTSNAQRSIQTVGRWTLIVQRWAFLLFSRSLDGAGVFSHPPIYNSEGGEWYVA